MQFYIQPIKKINISKYFEKSYKNQNKGFSFVVEIKKLWN